MISARESLIPFQKASEHVAGKPHISTLHRWRLRGVRGVKLETVLIGGRRFTSDEALSRFFARTTAAADGRVPDKPQSRTHRKREIADAEAELRDL